MEDQLSSAEVETLRNVALRLSRKLRRHANAPLTPAQMSALSTLERRGAMQIGELARREQIGKSSVTRLVTNLEVSGYVTRDVDPADARGFRIDLTETGRHLLEESNAMSAAYLRRALALLEPADRRHIAEALPGLERLLALKP